MNIESLGHSQLTKSVLKCFAQPIRYHPRLLTPHIWGPTNTILPGFIATKNLDTPKGVHTKLYQIPSGATHY
jgi:hypothetical protein